MDITKSPFGTGAIITEQSPTMFHLGSVTPSIARPSVFMPSYGIPIENQAYQPACGSHAGYELGAILKTIDRGHPQHFSPEYLWKKIKQVDGFHIEDGTDIGSIMKCLAKPGICDDILMPNMAGFETLAQYADPVAITPTMDASASGNKIGAYAFTYSPTMDDIKQAIYIHKAIILLVRIGAEFWSPSYQEKDILPLKTTFPIVSGHFITAYAYDEQYIYFYNHWSASWGRAGIGYFGENYISRVIVIATAVDLAKNYSFSDTVVIRQGVNSTDVGIMQLVLRKDGEFPSSTKITSYFGPITFQAVKDFQLKYKDEILTPAGLTEPTGNVGPYTRAKLNKLLASQ